MQKKTQKPIVKARKSIVYVENAIFLLQGTNLLLIFGRVYHSKHAKSSSKMNFAEVVNSYAVIKRK